MRGGKHQDILNRLHAQYLGDRKETHARREAPASTPVPLEDAQLLDLARNSANGDLFRALFDRGDASAYGGDESAADQALCNMLVWWTDHDAYRTERLVSASARGQRSKWRDRADYRKRTIQAALDRVSGSYDPSYGPKWSWDPGERAPEPAPEPSEEEDELLLAAEYDGSNQDMSLAMFFLQAWMIERELRERDQAELKERREIMAATAQLIKRPDLKPPEKLVAAAAIPIVHQKDRSAQSDGRVYLAELAEATGTSKATASRCINTLSDPDTGIFEKHVKTEWQRTNRATGEITDLPRPQTYMTLAPRAPTVVASIRGATVMTLPERPKHGGKRIRRCQHHPDAHAIARTTYHCSECDALLERSSDRPVFQDETPKPTPPHVRFSPYQQQDETRDEILDRIDALTRRSHQDEMPPEPPPLDLSMIDEPDDFGWAGAPS